MANSIYWGMGASNNLIGWGQASVNNTIYFGKAQTNNNFSGETDIVGKNFIVANTFKSNVEIDLGTFESLNCLISTLNKI